MRARMEKDKVEEMPACTSVDEVSLPVVVENKMVEDTTLAPAFRISASSFLDESLLDGRHLVVKCTLGSERPIDTDALTNCGASGYSFIDEQFVCQHNLPRYQLRTPRALEVIDGRPISSGVITEIVRIPMSIGGHRENLPAFITTLGQYPLVLGIPWLNQHGVVADFGKNTLTFSPECMKRGCMHKATTIQGTPPLPKRENTPESPPPKKNTASPRKLCIAAIGPASYRRML